MFVAEQLRLAGMAGSSESSPFYRLARDATRRVGRASRARRLSAPQTAETSRPLQFAHSGAKGAAAISPDEGLPIV
jgi:hypothetical protein